MLRQLRLLVVVFVLVGVEVASIVVTVRRAVRVGYRWNRRYGWR